MGAPPRMQQYIEAKHPPPLPDLPDGGEYMVEVMLTLSPVRAMPMGGFRPADWPEIAPFMQATGAITEAWEADFLHQMCRSYCAGWNAGHVAAARSPMEIKEREERGFT